MPDLPLEEYIIISMKMELTIRYVSSLLALIWVLHTLITFLRFYIIGRRTGFPVYIVPIQTRSAPWMLLNSILRPYLEKYLPEWIYERIDMVSAGWEFRRKAEMHQRLGPAFVIVTLNQCALWYAPTAGRFRVIGPNSGTGLAILRSAILCCSEGRTLYRRRL
jgi:hypothetical protein